MDKSNKLGGDDKVSANNFQLSMIHDTQRIFVPKFSNSQSTFVPKFNHTQSAYLPKLNDAQNNHAIKFNIRGLYIVEGEV